MKKTIMITGGFLLLSTFHALAQMKPAATLSRTTIKSLHGKKVLVINPRALSLKHTGKSTAKTTSPLRLYAVADYDLSVDPSAVMDSTHYSYNATRGWGTDNPMQFDEALSFEDDGTGLSGTNKTTQTFDAHDNILTAISENLPASAGKMKTNYTYDTHDNVLSKTFHITSGSTWTLLDSTLYSYSGTSHLDSSLQWQYDEAGTLTGSYKNLYKYNINDSLIETFQQMQEPGSTDWVDNSSITRTFDASGKHVVTELFSDYWAITEEWKDSRQYVYTYDAAGNRITEQDQLWDDDAAAWKDYYTSADTYDASGLLLTSLVTQTDETGAIDTGRATFTYNADKLLNVVTGEYMDPDMHVFMPDIKTIYYYDDKATSIPTVNRGGSLSLYPVPANNELTLDLQWDKVQKASVSITDLQGRVWQQWTLPAVQQYKEKVALSNLPSGNYVLRISGNENARVTQQFTVVR